MADTRYLKKRRQTWYFCIKVPADIVSKLGKSDIVLSLKTRDLTEAQKQRWPLVAEWTARFEVANGTRPWTPAEIEVDAQREFQATLEMLNEYPHDEEITSIYADLEAEKLAEKNISERDRALTVARIQVAVGRKAALKGQPYTAPTVFGRNSIDLVTLQPITATPKKSKGLSFSDAAERYIEETQRDVTSKLTEQTRGQYEAVYRLFIQWAKDPQLADIEREHAAKFLDKVATLNPNWGRSPQTKQRDFKAIYELPQTEVAQVVGHERGGITYGTYNPDGLSIEALQQVVEAISYPELEAQLLS